MTAAQKAGEAVTLSVLRLVMAECKNKAIALMKGEAPLTDEETLAVLQKEAKKRKEAMTLYGEGKRDDLLAKESEELMVLERYLPKALSPEELATLITTVQKEGVSGFGPLMKEILRRAGGRADGTLVANALKAQGIA